jgi:hypothetical protein
VIVIVLAFSRAEYVVVGQLSQGPFVVKSELVGNGLGIYIPLEFDGVVIVCIVIALEGGAGRDCEQQW